MINFPGSTVNVCTDERAILAGAFACQADTRPGVSRAGSDVSMFANLLESCGNREQISAAHWIVEEICVAAAGRRCITGIYLERKHATDDRSERFVRGKFR